MICVYLSNSFFVFFFFTDTATTEIYTLSLHDALPISEEQAAVPGAAQEAITRPLPARHRTSPLGGYRLGSVRSLAAVLWLLLLLLFVAACAVTVAELVWAMTSDLGATAIATIGWTG